MLCWTPSDPVRDLNDHMNFVGRVNNYVKRAYAPGRYPRAYEILRTDHLRLLYYGFLGDENFGDEWVWQSARNLFSPHLLIPIGRHVPVGHIILNKVLREGLYDGVVIGGGTLIGGFQDFPLFKTLVSNAKPLPVFFHGTGVDVSRKSLHPMWDDLLSRDLYGGVRGAQSAAYLQQTRAVGLPVVGDAALLVQSSDSVGSVEEGEPWVAVNLGTHLKYASSSRVLAEIVKFSQTCFDTGFLIKFVACHGNDLACYNEISRCLDNHLPLIDIRGAEGSTFVDQLRTAEFALGERLHFGVAAAMAGIPFLSITYGEKHRDFLESVGLARCGVAPHDFSAELATTHWKERSSFGHGYLKTISGLCDCQRAEAARFVQACAARRA